MTLHGSACANLSPILFKGNNRSLGVNVIIQQDESGSMASLIEFYSDGSFIGSLQDALLNEKIGDDITRYPNLYSYFGNYGRNPNKGFSISNPNGTLNVTESFIRGESTGASTISKWIGTNYFLNSTSPAVNICTNVIGTTTNSGRLLNFNDPNIATFVPGVGGSPKSEDVHGSLWSIFTTPNAISTGIPGKYGKVIGSLVRRGSTTIIITNSDEQSGAPSQMLNELVSVNSTGTQQRTINGSTGELVFRGYRVIALSSYSSTDGYDGVLFYGSTSTQPYGYVKFTSNTTYTITRSSSFPNWIRSVSSFNNSLPQVQDTLTLASETRGGLFKLFNVFTTKPGIESDRRIAFSKCLAEFIADTV